MRLAESRGPQPRLAEARNSLFVRKRSPQAAARAAAFRKYPQNAEKHALGGGDINKTLSFRKNHKQKESQKG